MSFPPNIARRIDRQKRYATAQFLEGPAGLSATASGAALEAGGNLAAILAELITIDGRVDGVEALLTTLGGYLDGVETLVGATNTAIAATNTALATSNALLTTQNGYLAGFSYAHITTSTTTVVKSGAGLLHAVTINSKGTIASTVTIYDNTAGSGTVIGIIDSLTLSGSFFYDAIFATGLTLVTTGTAAPDVSVFYR